MKSKIYLILSFVFVWGSVQVHAQCNATVNVSNYTGCAGSRTLSATTNAAGVTVHRWYTAQTGGSLVSGVSQQNPAGTIWISSLTANFNANTSYWVAPVCGSTEGSRTKVSFTLASGISITSSGNPLAFCQGATLTASGGSNYQWSLGTSSTDPNPTILSTATTITPSASGFYFLKGTNSCGAQQTTYKEIFYIPIVTASMSPSGSGTVRIKYNGLLTASPVSASYYYNWKKDGTQMPTTTSTYTVTEGGVYTVSISNGACAAGPTSPSVTIAINKLPTASISPSVINVTWPNNSVTISGTSSDPDGSVTSTAWTQSSGPNTATLSGTNTLFLNVSNLVLGTYTFTLTVTDDIGESATATATVTVAYPPNNYNWIKETVVQVRDNTTDAQVMALTVPQKQKIETWQYFDGLGRPMQTVSTQASPLLMDVVAPIAYDAYGREAIKYLPYVSGNTGWYKDNFLPASDANYATASNAQYQFYKNTDKVSIDAKPYAETRFEPWPLNRVVEQGAPGAAWQPDATDSYTSTDRTIKKAYEFNLAGEVLLWTYTYPTPAYQLGLVNAGTVSSPVYYAANQLYKNKTKDEQYHEVIEYVDNEGRTVLKRVQVSTTNNTSTTDASKDTNWASTYYIYDDFGHLVCVIPPEATNQLSANYYQSGSSDVTKDAFLKRWSFRYAYDPRGRMVMKQVPGAEPVFMVYDNRDRLVMTQDGNQRNAPTQTWTFTKYDALNRPVLTGIIANTSDRVTLQDNVNTYYNSLTAGKAWFETYKGSTGAILGYDNASFPQSTSENDYLTATYYDQYDTYIAPTGYTYSYESLTDPETSLPLETAATINAGRVNGQATASCVKLLNTATWLRTVNYYDQKYRLVQTISDHQKGKITISNIVDFTGKVVYTKRIYVVNGISRYIIENPHFDHVGRLLWVKHNTNGAGDVILVKNEYNELGQLVDKKLHSSATDGTGAKQSVDYRYNIRGWLTKVNEADVSAVASGDVLNDYFGMELGYQENIGNLATTNKLQFNGNISAVQWSKGNGGTLKKQGYVYTYDAMNRLTLGDHFTYNSAAWNNESGAFSESIGSYDLNGNINALTRKGFSGSSMDVLSYGYAGNQLNYVHDTGDATKGYINGNTGTDDYSYDYNGNMDKDKNKGFTNKGDIKYNHLNLPIEIVKGTEKVKYIYNAAGMKLAQEVYDTNNTLTKTTDYIGEMVFENNILQFINHAEGRVLVDGSVWEYQYHLKDHLGNVRVTFTAKPQTTTSYTTDFEAASNSNFQNYTTNTFDLVDHTDAGTTYTKVQLLNGGPNSRVGVSKSLSVMPGDEVTISAWAKYMNLGSTGNPNALITSLASAFGVGSGSTGEQLKLYNGLNSYANTVTGGDHDYWTNDNEGAPKAFVTILFFDKDYNLLDAAWKQVTTTGAQTSATVKQPPHDFMTITAKAPEAGYAIAFVSNEHPYFVDVYFDDLTIAYTPSPIVSASDYYPFGATFNSYSRENTVANKELYQSKEWQTDLGLNQYDFEWRQYDPFIVRTTTMDPHVELFYPLSPYSWAGNNPLLYVDPDGRTIVGVNYTEDDKGQHYDLSNASEDTKKMLWSMLQTQEGQNQASFLGSTETEVTMQLTDQLILDGAGDGSGFGLTASIISDGTMSSKNPKVYDKATLLVSTFSKKTADITQQDIDNAYIITDDYYGNNNGSIKSMTPSSKLPKDIQAWLTTLDGLQTGSMYGEINANATHEANHLRPENIGLSPKRKETDAKHGSFPVEERTRRQWLQKFGPNSSVAPPQNINNLSGNK